MRPSVLRVRGGQSSNVYTPDHYISPMNVALAVRVSGTITCTVQYTFDDVFALNYSPSSGNWTNHPSLTSLAIGADSNIAYPVTGIRIVGNTGGGEAFLTIIQAGGGGLS